jgi:alcohol dehydrogenase class IV
MQFKFFSSTQITFGPGKLNSIGDIAREYGKRAFILFGCPKSITDRLIDLLDTHGISCTTVKIEQEPTVDLIGILVDLARQFSPDLVIGIGGGSAIDSAKSTAIFITNSGELMDYLEVIGKGEPFLSPPLPLITIPTTAGTGAEVTKNAVLGSIKHLVKVSLRSPYLFPKVALVDPELTISMPPEITAYTGLDALTQLIEPYTCIEPNPLVDSLCRDGIQRIAQSLYQVFDNGKDLHSREDMSLASLFSGIALANAKLGAVHGLAGSIGGEIPAPHGAICACLLANVMEINIAAINEQLPGHPVMDRYNNVGKILCNHPDASATDGMEWIREFCLHAKIPPLSAYGLTEQKISKIIDKAKIASSMKGNPITLSDVELRNILHKSLL